MTTLHTDTTVELSSMIGGSRRRAEAARSTNPANLEDVSPRSRLGDAATLVAACRAAADGQARWRRVPPRCAGRDRQAAELVRHNKAALAALVTREIGKPTGEALGEVQEVIDTCEFFLGEGRRLYGMTVPSEMPDKQLFTFAPRSAWRRSSPPATSPWRCPRGT